jgi:hypothetical protein
MGVGVGGRVLVGSGVSEGVGVYVMVGVQVAGITTLLVLVSVGRAAKAGNVGGGKGLMGR